MNKYVDLIIAMKKTRGDWSQGFYRVKDVLKKFNIETKEDELICNNLWEQFDCQDGRVFRDCEYNYDVLTEKFLSKEEKQIVDKEMVKWYE